LPIEKLAMTACQRHTVVRKLKKLRVYHETDCGNYDKIKAINVE
jgi:hypothetical protein